MTARLTLADVSRQPSPGLDQPISVEFSPDGRAVTYLHDPGGTLVRSLWWHDLETGTRHELLAPARGALNEEELTPAQHLDRERRRVTTLGVTSAAWSSGTGSSTLLARSGDLAFAWRGAAGGVPTMRAVPAANGASAVILSPRGDLLALVRDDEVWICELPDGEARRLTRDAAPGIRNGLAEFAAAEELDRFDGLWWSEDGSTIACATIDEREIPEFTITGLSSTEPAAETHRYPFAGGPNVRVALRILRVSDGEPATVDLPIEPGDYLARVVARPGGGWLVAVLPRDQRTLRWVWVERDGAVRAAWVESAKPWINLDTDTHVLADARILRSTERTGFRHLELRAPDGSLERQLTAGPWVVTSVVHVDERAGEVLFIGTRHGVTDRHLYAVALDADEPARDPRRMTAEPGWHAVGMSRDGSRWVDTWSSLEIPPRVVVRHRDGSQLAVIHEPSTSAQELGLVVPELLTLRAADGATPLRAAIYRPPAGAADPPPAVLAVYGGPHAQRVLNSWELTVTMARQFLCAAGAAVVVVDNRGSANRGLAFEAPLGGALGVVEVSDQIEALRLLSTSGDIDLGRVAVTGGSYGGYMTIRLMTRHPELFRAGVAISPVTCWDGYDTAYTERYLGRPDAEETAYRDGSLLANAGSLAGDLLIMHGELDENVHLRHSVRYLTELNATGGAARFVILPGSRHQVRSRAVAIRDRMLLEHLAAGLGLPIELEPR
jgi:dipeptidyl-peptidase 4